MTLVYVEGGGRGSGCIGSGTFRRDGGRLFGGRLGGMLEVMP